MHPIMTAQAANAKGRAGAIDYVVPRERRALPSAVILTAWLLAGRISVLTLTLYEEPLPLRGGGTSGLIPSHFKCRFFPSGDAPRSGFALRMTHQSQERADIALVCHPERSEGSGVKNLQAEILRPKNRPQDDITLQTLPTNCLFCTITFPEGKNRPPIPCSDHSNLNSLSRQGRFSSP